MLHLIVDGYGNSREKLEDLQLIYAILDGYPSQIGMTKVMPPYVVTHQDREVEDWGVSGFVIIAESHISIHTFPMRQCVNVDIFSCKDFIVEQAVDYVQEKLELSEVRTRIVKRDGDPK